MQASNRNSSLIDKEANRKREKKFRATVAKFTEFVLTQEHLISSYGVPTTLYRGQTQDWPLLPSILRENITDIHNRSETCLDARLKHIKTCEQLFLSIFRKESSTMTNRPLTNKELYYLAQHHGLPTRLLDWTKNPRIALWFAVQGNDDKSGYIYTLEAYELHRKTLYSKEREGQYYDHIIHAQQQAKDLGSGFKEIMNGDILLIDPESYNERQSRQSSMFTLHLPDLSASDKFHTENSIIKQGNFLRDKLEILPAEKRILRTWLRLEGMREWDIFPDLDHLTKGILSECT